MPPKITSWLSDGELIQVITAQQPGEAIRPWCKRHEDAVEFWMGVFPPDTE